LWSVRVVGQMDEIVGRHFPQTLKRARRDVHAVDVTHVLVQGEVAVDLKHKMIHCRISKSEKKVERLRDDENFVSDFFFEFRLPSLIRGF
jgi:hypothetical protein